MATLTKTEMTQINSGNFAKGEGNKGNYNGYDDTGRVFIHKTVMERLGWKSDTDVKFPFFAITKEEEITPFDENGEPMKDAEGKEKKVSRLQASAIFKTKEETLKAYNAKAVLKAEAQDQLNDIALDRKLAIKAKATSAGLSESAVNALLAQV
jgi:hypothetical protein